MNQALNISESVCAYFDGFDSTVDAFGGAITGFEHDCIDDSPQMFSNGFGYFFIGSSRQHIAQLSQRFHPLSAQVRWT